MNNAALVAELKEVIAQYDSGLLYEAEVLFRAVEIGLRVERENLPADTMFGTPV